MVLFRRLLVRLRDEFNSDARRLYSLLGLTVAALAVITLLVDALLPVGGYANLLRSFLLVPTALGIFCLGYSVSLFFHAKRLEEEPDWLPYRARFSPSWRRRMAIIGGAVLLVLTQAVNPGVGYTLASACVGALVLMLLAFIRTTQQESNRETLGIPDSRDVVYDAQKRQVEREFALRQAKKKESRRSKLKGNKASATKK